MLLIALFYKSTIRNRRGFLTVLIFSLIFSNTFAQGADGTLPRLVGDNTLITTSGFKIVVGEFINIGTGATPDGDFKFIRRNSTGFGTVLESTSNNSYNKSQFGLPRKWAGHKGRVVKIKTRGNKKVGITYEPLIAFGDGDRFEIDVDNAIAAEEIIVPDEFKPKPKNTATVVEIRQTISVADELTKLKKLFDDGVLTKSEYEVQKKKLLGSY